MESHKQLEYIKMFIFDYSCSLQLYVKPLGSKIPSHNKIWKCDPRCRQLLGSLLQKGFGWGFHQEFLEIPWRNTEMLLKLHPVTFFFLCKEFSTCSIGKEQKTYGILNICGRNIYPFPPNNKEFGDPCDSKHPVFYD